MMDKPRETCPHKPGWFWLHAIGTTKEGILVALIECTRCGLPVRIPLDPCFHDEREEQG